MKKKTGKTRAISWMGSFVAVLGDKKVACPVFSFEDRL